MAACQGSLSFTISWSLLRLMSIELVMLSNQEEVTFFFSFLQSFPASGSFPVSRFFTSGSQSIGVSASASVLPMNIHVSFNFFTCSMTISCLLSGPTSGTCQDHLGHFCSRDSKESPASSNFPLPPLLICWEREV